MFLHSWNNLLKDIFSLQCLFINSYQESKKRPCSSQADSCFHLQRWHLWHQTSHNNLVSMEMAVFIKIPHFWSCNNCTFASISVVLCCSVSHSYSSCDSLFLFSFCFSSHIVGSNFLLCPFTLHRFTLSLLSLFYLFFFLFLWHFPTTK